MIIDSKFSFVKFFKGSLLRDEKKVETDHQRSKNVYVDDYGPPSI
jgi:hypothetical protein